MGEEMSQRAGLARAGPLRCVVVATDFSTGGKRAVERAARLLDPRTRVILVHVLPAKMRGQQEAVANANASLTEVASQLRAVAGGVAVDAVLAFGEAYVEIVKLAEGQSDLVVVGRHGTRRFRDLLLGTTAERVVRHTTLPVLVVHGSPKRPYARLLAALGQPPETAQRSLDVGMLLLGAYVQERRAVHVEDDLGDDALGRHGITQRDTDRARRARRADLAARLKTWLKTRYGGALHWRIGISMGEPRGCILRAAARNKPDLICLGTQGRTGLSRLIVGSVAEAVLHGASCDVLIAHSGEALEAEGRSKDKGIHSR